jgi:predicted lactoylglutathione lyase
MRLPPPVPELPVGDVGTAADAYLRQMGFRTDWTYQGDLAGISKDDARVFLRRRAPGEERNSVVVWLNMNSAGEVDQLHAEWKERGVAIVEGLKTASYNLREFVAQDSEGHRWRVFHDLGGSTE